MTLLPWKWLFWRRAPERVELVLAAHVSPDEIGQALLIDSLDRAGIE
jgi:hypothetical protein